MTMLVGVEAWAGSGESARVSLPEMLARAEPTEPREPSSLLKLLLSGALEPGKKLVGHKLQATVFSEGVEAKPPWIYRLGEQRVVAILFHNPEGAAPWVPRVVRLTSGLLGPEPVTISAHMRTPQLMPGESGWVVMEWPVDDELAAFRLEVREGESGRGMRLVRGSP